MSEADKLFEKLGYKKDQITDEFINYSKKGLKYNSSTKKYVKIGTTKNNNYLNKNLKSKSTYYYKDVPCASINKTIKFSGVSSSALKCTTK